MLRSRLLPALIGLAAVLMGWGSTGVWAKAPFLLELKGTDTGPGQRALITAVLCLALAVLSGVKPNHARAFAIVALIGFLHTFLVGIVNWRQVDTSPAGALRLSILGWGLIVLTAAALSGMLISIAQIIVGSAKRPRSKPVQLRDAGQGW